MSTLPDTVLPLLAPDSGILLLPPPSPYEPRLPLPLDSVLLLLFDSGFLLLSPPSPCEPRLPLLPDSILPLLSGSRLLLLPSSLPLPRSVSPPLLLPCHQAGRMLPEPLPSHHPVPVLYHTQTHSRELPQKKESPGLCPGAMAAEQSLPGFSHSVSAQISQMPHTLCCISP